MRILFGFIIVALFAYAGSAKADCFPTCREGYVCSPENQCVSACNPPCAANEACSNAGACVARTPSPSPARAPNPAAQPIVEAQAPVMANYLIGGFDSAIATDSAFGIGIAVGHVFFGDHDGFLVGARLGLYFGDAGGIRIGPDVGYRAMLIRGRVSAGFLLVFQPHIYYGGGNDPFLGLGGSLGPIVEYDRLYLQLPIGASFLQRTDLIGGSHSSDYTLVHISLLAGMNF